jgi:hypothetical protein
MMVAGYRAGGKKVYATRRQAYYAIAKALVVAKYPAWTTSDTLDVAIWHGQSVNWEPELVAARRRKARLLFWSVGEGSQIYDFDDHRWVALVRRVARYLEWVDGRLGEAAQLEAWFTETEHLQAQEQYAENMATKFADRAIHYHNELARRSVR